MKRQTAVSITKHPWRGVGALAAAGLVLAGCGSSGGDSPFSGSATQHAPTTTSGATSPATGPTGSVATGPTGSSATSAPERAAAMVAAMKAASAVHVRAHGTTGGRALQVDVHYGSGSAEGSISIGTTTIALINAGGGLYFKAPDSFWKQQVPQSKQSAVLAVVSGKWVKAPQGNSDFADLAQFADMGAFVSQLTGGLQASAVTEGPRKTVDGVDAIGIVDAAKHTTIYVPAHGTPLPIKSVKQDSTDGGTVSFTDWNKPFTADPPPADQVVDLSQFLN